MSHFFQDFEKEYQVSALDRNDVQNRKVSHFYNLHTVNLLFVFYPYFFFFLNL